MSLKELISFWLVLLSLELLGFYSCRTTCNAKVTLLGSQVKPGLPYLDIIRLLRDESSLPIAAYQVLLTIFLNNFFLQCPISCSYLFLS